MYSVSLKPPTFCLQINPLYTYGYTTRRCTHSVLSQQYVMFVNESWCLYTARIERAVSFLALRRHIFVSFYSNDGVHETY